MFDPFYEFDRIDAIEAELFKAWEWEQHEIMIEEEAYNLFIIPNYFADLDESEDI